MSLLSHSSLSISVLLHGRRRSPPSVLVTGELRPCVSSTDTQTRPESTSSVIRYILIHGISSSVPSHRLPGSSQGRAQREPEIQCSRQCWLAQRNCGARGVVHGTGLAQSPRFDLQHPIKPGLVIHTCDPSTGEAEAGHVLSYVVSLRFSLG